MSLLFLLQSEHTDGWSVFTDSSPYNRTITRAGNTHHETSQAKFGLSSIQFDGSGDYLSIPSSTDLDFGTGEFTIDFWLYVASITDYDVICARLDSWGSTGRFLIRLHPGIGGLEVLIGQTVVMQNASLPVGAWNHVAVTGYQGDYFFYVNGVNSGVSYGSGAVISATTPFYIGHNPVNAAEQLNGFIEEFRITSDVDWRYPFNYTQPTDPYWFWPMVGGGRYVASHSTSLSAQSPADAYIAWATALGVSTTATLQALEGDDDFFLVDTGAPWFPGGPTSAVFSTEGAISFYRGTVDTSSGEYYDGQGSWVTNGAMGRMYGPKSRPTLMLSFRVLSDLAAFDTKVQRSGNTTIIFAKFSRYDDPAADRYDAALKITPGRVELVGTPLTSPVSVFITEFREVNTATEMVSQKLAFYQSVGTHRSYVLEADWLTAQASVPSPLLQPGPAPLGALPVEGIVSRSNGLGDVLSMGRVHPASLISLPSVFGDVRTVALHDFTAFVGTETTYYVMDLMTPGGAVRVPISSWQATLQTGALCYVQCVIPSVGPFVSHITSATSFSIKRRTKTTTGVLFEYEMASTDISSASYARGPTNYTCTLSGYAPAFAEDTTGSTATDRVLTSVRQVTNGDGGTRVQCAIDWLLRPGQRAIADGITFTASYINYYVTSSNDQYMEVGERV